MKNATLVINNGIEFSEDIWQYDSGFVESEWKDSIKYQAETLQKLYNQLSDTEEFGGGTEELYALGDVINMLNSIDVILN